MNGVMLLVFLLHLAHLSVGSEDPLVFNTTKNFIVTFQDDPTLFIQSTPTSSTFMAYYFQSLREEGDTNSFYFADHPWTRTHSTWNTQSNVTVSNVTFTSRVHTQKNSLVVSVNYLLLTYNGPQAFLPASIDTFWKILFRNKPLVHVDLQARDWPWGRNATGLVLSTHMDLNAIILTTQNTTAHFEIDAVYVLANNLVTTFPHMGTLDGDVQTINTTFVVDSNKKPIRSNLTFAVPRFNTSLSYPIFIELVEIVSGSDLALVLGLPLGIIMVVSLVLFMTTYYFNHRLERAERRSRRGKRLYFSIEGQAGSEGEEEEA
eukprot:TRINITY_DN16049_c0_g1_i1.p1 TRINITY_DN16049_c0_g1~~TRINITY_DN16049_c0_g1_i1.p1  ORF type:complete len:338 (+),score=58.87 TRINITY_DN16049_c0_g1_i1:62-1015(+)